MALAAAAGAMLLLLLLLVRCGRSGGSRRRSSKRVAHKRREQVALVVVLANLLLEVVVLVVVKVVVVVVVGVVGVSLLRAAKLVRRLQRRLCLLAMLVLLLVRGKTRRAQLGRRVLVRGNRSGRRGHVKKGAVVRLMRERRLRWVIVLVVGLLDSIVNCHGAARAVAVFAATPVGDVFVVVAPNLVVPVAVEDERRSASLSWNKCDC